MRYFKKDSVLQYERKFNNFYYQNKLFIFLLILLVILGIVMYRTEKEVIKRKKIIEKYKLTIAIITYLKMPTTLGPDLENVKKILNDVIKKNFEEVNEKINEYNNEKCKNENVCIKRTVKDSKNFNLNKELEKQIKILQYTTENIALRNALIEAYKSDNEENWEYVLDLLTDELLLLVPNITSTELCKGLGTICVSAFAQKNALFGLAYLIGSKK